jgi:hypothetical protein
MIVEYVRHRIADDRQDPFLADHARVAQVVEWGTRLAVANSRPGAEVVRAAPVPRWGWGVAPPWTR